MKLFEKKYKYTYDYFGNITRKYIVYKILFFKISKRIHTNILIDGKNNNFLFGLENGNTEKINNPEILATMGFSLNIVGDNNTITIPKNQIFKSNKIVISGNNSEFIIKNTKQLIQRSTFILGNNSKIIIGENFSSNGINIVAATNTEISIGNSCMIGRNIHVRTTDGHKIKSCNNGEILNLPKNVKIGNRVWLADNAVVFKGVVIQDNCAVWINSVVTKQFEESNCVIAGNPAKIVKRGITWER